MGIRFVYGRSGAGKTHFCLQAIKKRIDENKEGKFILIVPEQFTFRAENALLNQVGERALLKTEVLSFKRMAQRVFSECGGLTIRKMQDSGKAMIIYKVLQEIEKELKIFNKASKQNGFIDIIDKTITEFKKYNITPEILEEISKDLSDENLELKYKLIDLEKIYLRFNEVLHENYIDTDDELTMLSTKLEDCKLYDKTEIWIDEFTTFTPQQLDIIKTISKKAKRVNITLVGDEWNPKEEVESTDLFNVTKSTEKRILKIMEENRIPFDGVINVNDGTPYKLRGSKELAHLERYFYSYPFNEFKNKIEGLSIYKASNSYEEIQTIAKNIKEYVRDKGYRYKDISIVCRNIDDYEKITSVIFNEYEIPYYIDKKRDILNNPFVVLVTSLFEVYNKNWNYESLFKYLKTGLTGLETKYIDIIENYVLAYGVNKKHWLSEEEWDYYPLGFSNENEQDENMKILINEIKDEVKRPLISFYNKTKGEKKVREICEAIYDFLTEINAVNRVSSWIDKFNKEGIQDKEKEYSQILSIVMEVLDQAVDVMGNEKMDIKKFSKVLTGGFEKYELGLIPLSLDEVTVGDITRVRSKEVRILFLIGVNDGVIPATTKDEGILSDRDRELLKNKGVTLASDSKAKVFEEQLLVYTALTISSERLIITYPMADFEGKSLRPSIIIPRIKKLFPKLIEDSDINKKAQDFDKIVAPIPTFNELIGAVRKDYDEEVVEEYWGEVYSWYKKEDKWKKKAKNLERALNYTNQDEDLPKDKARKIYSSQNGKLLFSVSRLEKYAQCPFSYYVQYGLKAKDRKIYEFSAPDLGSFMHEILDGFTTYVRDKKLNWSELDKDKCSNIISMLVDKKLDENQGFILNSSKRYKYFTDRFKRILSKSVSAVSEHMKRSTFEIYKNEFEFSSFKDAEPIKIKLDDGEEVSLVGRVDRVDVADIDGESYIRVIDYKSGSKKFDLTKLYHGLQIQLLVYLDALIKNSKYFLNKSTLPGAILYFRIDDPLIAAEKRITEEEIQKKVLSSFKMDGLVLKDPKIIKAMDNDPGLYSVVIPAGIKKDGDVSSTSSVATEEQFETLRKYVNYKIKEICSDMLKGNIKINPAKESNFAYCDFCDYSSVCQFDTSLKDNKYKLIKLKKKEEVWEEMQEDIKRNEEGGGKVMATKWTEEQLQAINTRGCNLLVAAAAGSGKTAVLVERIIKIITDKENPVDIDKLLVVTFTSAAAGEMRERIADAISKELEKEPNSKNLQRQLTLLSKANITTMHSFCLDTIKNNFHHIDLDPAFRISDDTEGTLMKLETLTELFEEKYDQENKEFILLLDAYGSGKDDKKLQELVLNLYEFSMSGPWPENWLKEKSEDFNIDNEEELENTPWIKVLKESVLLELNSLIKNLYIALDLAENSGGLEPYGENLNDDINILNNIRVSLEEGSLKEIYLKVSGVKFSTLKRVLAKNVEDPDTQERVKKIRDEVKKSIAKMGDGAFNVAPEEILEGLKLLYPLMKSLSNLVIDFKNRYEAKKRERGVLDFNDLEHLCLKILIDEDNGEIKPSSVASALREKFNEVLVDEYQDSNNVQETIINLVSRKELENPNVFMVGDVKQSIYRFRQAKPELFLEKYNSYGTEDTDKNRKIMLYKNFRSREEVINGVNFIFTQLMSTTVGELEYDEKEALNLGASYGYPEEEGVQVAGDIELHIIDKSGKEEKEEYEVTEEIEIDPEEEEDLTAVQIEARIVGNRINNLMNPKDGSIYKVLDKGTGEYRKIRFKDIVILLRATKNWADTFLEELGAMGIPIYADTGSGYFETIEIRTILSVLQVIDNPLQDVPIISTLRSPIFSFTAEELADLRIIGEEDYYFETIEKIALGEKEVNESLKEKCTYFIESIKRWREKAIYTPIDEFIWYLYMDTSYYGYVGAMSNGIQRQANLRILFQRARQFERTSFKGLFNFINFIHRLRSSSGDMGSAKILGENEDVVRIMSIHKSKGLEFPVVFLSGCGKQFNLMDLNKEVLFHEDLGFGPQVIDVERRVSYPSIAKNSIKKKFLVEALSEEMRILYVALTRAKEKLIITGATTNFDRSVDKWRRSTALGDNKISPSEVLKKRSFLDWIALALCRHKDGGILRGENSFVENLSLDNSHWNINLWRKSQMPVEENFIAVDKNEEKELFINKEYKSINKEIERRLGFKYKYRESSLLPSNISVSDLKKRAYEDLQEEATYDVFKVEKVIKPVFLQEERGLSPAERGTIVHFFMQKLELGKSNTYGDIKEQIEDLINRDLLREDESKVINIKKISNFMNSNLGQRMKSAFEEGREVNRELAFYTEISALNFDKTLPKEYETERVRLQGVIDAYFEEEDGIVLLDYKTDYVGEKGVEEIIDRYRLQLDYYEEALEKITGKKVKERYLYLFNVDKEVKI